MKKTFNKQILFRRIAAAVYDSFILFSFWILLTALALVLNRGESLLSYQALFLAYLFIATGLFQCYFWCKKSQTVGMAAWRLKMVQSSDLPLSWGQAWLRYCLAWLALLTGGILWFTGLVDKLSHTQIILVPPQKVHANPHK
jgi:uncharacterized RDD family membrane protein YckC